MDLQTINKVLILLVLAAITILFVIVLEPFLITVLLSAIIAGLSYPFFQWLRKKTKGRDTLSASLTVILLLLLVFLPLLFVLGLVIDEAIYISGKAKPWFENFIEANSSWEFLHAFPYYEQLVVYKDQILAKTGETISSISSVLFKNISSFTFSTLKSVFLFFVFIYSLFFFIRDGNDMINKALYYFPMNDKEERQILGQFTSVTRATLKGTVIVGLIQGSLAGLGLWIVGVEGVLFWTAVMVVLSIIPVIGSVIIWLPVAIILFVTGQTWEAVFLIVYSVTIVSMIDNVLRPRLVGRDTQMHELLIFLSTLGGIAAFGVFGFIIGPIIAALFITMLDIYGKTFKDVLPKVLSKEEREQADLDNIIEPETSAEEKK